MSQIHILTRPTGSVRKSPLSLGNSFDDDLLKLVYIEVGANTLKSSSTFHFPTKIMFPLKKNFYFGENVGMFLGEQSTHIYNKICTN